MSNRNEPRIESAITCEKCGLANSSVIDSRPTDGFVRRRRVCLSCKNRWTTYEVGDSLMADIRILQGTPDITISAANKVVSMLRQAIGELEYQRTRHPENEDAA